MRLRGYLIIGAICVLFLIVWIIASAGANDPSAKSSYTTDSEISPDELVTWNAVYVSGPYLTEEIYYIVAENPLLRTPITSHVEYVLLRIDYMRTALVGYAYYIDTKLYVFELQAGDRMLRSGHFALVEIKEAKRKIIDYYLLKFLGIKRT